MNRTRTPAKTALVMLMTCAVTAAPAAASADSPPSSWTNLRTMNCDGVTVVAAFAPGSVSRFHLLGSTDVIVPQHVEVKFPGPTEPVTTLDNPGFAHNERGVVTCQYVDPAGLALTIVGIRT